MSVTVSFAEATAAARRIQAGYEDWPLTRMAADAKVLAGFVLAGDTERTCACAARRKQRVYLYDQWGLRIAHCDSTEPHGWHGWVGGNEDLRCPGRAALAEGGV